MIRLLNIMPALILGSALAGCAFLKEATAYHPPATDTPETMKAEIASFHLPKLADPGKAMVYVVRPSGMGFMIRFNVFVDDHEAASEMGYTRGSQYIYFQVSPGDHKIYSKAENWAEAQISPKAGDTIFIRQEPAMGIMMARNDISTMDEVLGTYQVKQTSLGTIIRTEKTAPTADASAGYAVAFGTSTAEKPAAALPEKELARPDWKSLSADESVKIYSQAGVFTGKFISYNGVYLWISLADGKKAFSTFEIQKLEVKAK